MQMIERMKLKSKVRSLNIWNIKSSDKLNISSKAYAYLYNNYKHMEDNEIISFIQREQLKRAIAKVACVHARFLDDLVNQIDITRNYNNIQYYNVKNLSETLSEDIKHGKCKYYEYIDKIYGNNAYFCVYSGANHSASIIVTAPICYNDEFYGTGE